MFNHFYPMKAPDVRSIQKCISAFLVNKINIVP